MFSIFCSHYSHFPFTFFVQKCYWPSLCFWGCFGDSLFLWCLQYSFISATTCFFDCVLVLHNCCLVGTSLSSSIIMGKWSRPLSSYFLLHLYSGAIFRLTSVRLLSICSHHMLYSSFFRSGTRNCLCRGFSLAFSIFYSFFHFPIVDCLPWSL